MMFTRSAILTVAGAGLAMAAACLGFAAAQPQARSQPPPQWRGGMSTRDLQAQIDRLPVSRGGIIYLSADVEGPDTIRMWEGVVLDGQGRYKLNYTGTGFALAVAKRAKQPGEREGGGVQNLWIDAPRGRGIARESWGHNLIGFEVRNCRIDAGGGDAMDFYPADGGWNYNVFIDNVQVRRPGGRALHLNANVYQVRNLMVFGAPRFKKENAPDALVKLYAVTDGPGAGGGGGEVIGGWFEAWSDEAGSVTQVLFGPGAHTLIGGHFEVKGPRPAIEVVARGAAAPAVVNLVGPKFMGGQGLVARNGALVQVMNPYPMPEEMLRRDAASTIQENSQKRGQLIDTAPKE